MVKIIIYGEPVPQGRPRFVRRGKFVTTYDPPKSVAYKKLVKLQAKAQYKDNPLIGALCVDLLVYRSMPKGGSKALRTRRLSGEDRPITKPDVDNYYKAVTDALTGIVYEDDNQIVHMTGDKFYTDNPRVELNITKFKFEGVDDNGLG